MDLEVLADYDMEPDAEEKAPEKYTNKTDKLPQALAAVGANIIALAVGTLLTWTSPATSMLQRDDSPFRITEHEVSWVGSLLALGSMFGGPPVGWLVNKVGRKLTILSLALPVTVSWILILTTKSVLWLYVARFMSGLSLSGMSFVVPIYVAEISEPSTRGPLSSITQLAYNTGILYAYAVGAVGNYMILNLACLLLPIIFVVVFVWMPEAPQYYLAKDNRAGAAKSLQWLRGKDANIDQELLKLKEEADEVARNKGSLGDLMKDALAVKAVAIAMGLVAVQQFCGICAVLFYTQAIFEAAGSTISATLSSVAVGLLMLLSSFLTMKLIHSFKRRILLMVSSMLQMVTLLVLGLYFLLKEELQQDVENISWLPLVSLMVYIVAFCQGPGPLPFIIMSEILPPKAKGIGGAIVASFCWFLSFVLTNTFQTFIDFLGRCFVFWLFAFMCAVSVLFVYFKVPETKGISLQEIQLMLSKDTRKSANGTLPS